MALEATFRELSVSFHRLHDALNALQLTLEDKPPHDEAALADDLADKSLEMLGVLHEARRGAINARRALNPPDMDRARRALTLCQERFHRIEQQFLANLVSYEKLKELARLGTERGREWRLWAVSTKQGIEQCRQPVEQSSKALAACWQELAERLGMVNFSVRSIGQQIKMAANAKAPEPEGGT
jgi:hypothetical protein